MATRTQKAATKQKAEAAAPRPAAKASAKAAKGPKAAKPAKQKAAAKPAKKGKRGKALAFEEIPADKPDLEQDPEVEFKETGPGFFARLKQRRAEKAAAREAEEHRRDVERREAEERARWAREEQEKLRLAQDEEARRQQEADERKMKAALKRAETRAAKEAEAEEAARREAEAALAKAAAQAEAKARRAAERQRKREELEAEERRLAEEQAARDAEEEVERRRLAVASQLKEQVAKEEKARELEPDLEFEEASKPVKDSHALVIAKGGSTAADAQAELVAAELAKRRSKPIVLEMEEPPVPRIPKAPLREGETYEGAKPARPVKDQPLSPEEAAARAAAANAAAVEEFGFTIPEAFLLLANGGGWDERVEKNREGSFGGALAGAMVLELLMRGHVMVQRDRIVVTGEATDDPALAAIAARLRRIREKKGDLTSLQQTGELAKANRELLTPFKQRLADKGIATYGSRKHLGLFHRSWVEIIDEGAQERLQNRLRRAIAGGGTPEAASILLLGLLDAAGLFDTVVPDEAADYNRKRLNGLLGGRDIMGYKVDPQLKALQEIATRAVLNNVRVMTVRG